MSARYRKLAPMIYRDPRFHALSVEGGKLLAVYLRTGPQTNRIGLFQLSIAATAEDLDLSPEQITCGLTAICDAFGWRFDPDCRVVLIPDWWVTNSPENRYVFKGNLGDLRDVPPSCPLIAAFVEHALATLPTYACRQHLLAVIRTDYPDHYPKGYRERSATRLGVSAHTSTHASRRRVTTRPPVQKQKQYQKQKQKQKQKPEPDARAVRVQTSRARAAAPTNGSNGSGNAFDCGGRIYVPQLLHTKLLRIRNHPDADRELREFYADVSSQWTTGAHAGDEPGADMFRFWEQRYSERWPATRPLPAARVEPRRAPWRDNCAHVPPCSTPTQHELAIARGHAKDAG